MIQKNTPELWDSIWKPTSEKEELFRIKKEEKNIQWQRIEKHVIDKFGSFKGLKTIELGAGSGTVSLLFALRGAEVTLLDYSSKALERGRIFFERRNIKVNLILQDALKLDKNLMNKFDVSMSFGLGEHFEGEDRKKIIKFHFDVLKKDGITFLSLPNRWNLPYMTWRFLSQSFGRWSWGTEIPFSRSELNKITSSLNKKSSFFGASLVASFELLNPLRILKRAFGIKKKFDLKNIKKERGTFLDEYFSSYIVLFGENKPRE